MSGPSRGGAQRVATPVRGLRRTAEAACRASDLAVRLRQGEGATGFYEFPLFVRNTGRTGCLLSGYPSHVLLSEPGQETLTAQWGGPFEGSVRPSRSVPPGGQAMLVIATENTSDCSAPRSRPPYHRVAIALGHGRGVMTVRRASGLNVECRVFATKFARVN